MASETAPKSEILQVNQRGGVTLPKAIRDQIPRDASVVKLSQVGEGRYLLEVVDVTPIADRWFHTPEWQAKEREADADIAAGRVRDISELGKPWPEER